jgi:hypothetical protein
VVLRIYRFQNQAHAWTALVRLQVAIHRANCSVEQHFLDAGVVMKIFNMDGRRAGNSRVKYV